MQNQELTDYVLHYYQMHGNKRLASSMAAYMKSDAPFFGVQKPQRDVLYRLLKTKFPPASQSDYERNILGLWSQPERECKYTAISYAGLFKPYIASDSLPLYESMVREGSWWDLVDPIAVDLIGHVYLNLCRNSESGPPPTMDKKLNGSLSRSGCVGSASGETICFLDERDKRSDSVFFHWSSGKEPRTFGDQMSKHLCAWIDDGNLWIRRTAIICQNKHKGWTNENLLFSFALQCADEREFFIRKAIGWALRNYSYINGEAVIDFVAANEKKFANLTVREALKALRRKDPDRVLAAIPQA